MTYILGISAFYHDSAASLVKDGKVISAIQEERLTRVKGDASFPKNSIKYLLQNNKINAEDISFVCFYEKPFLKFERLLETYLSHAPIGFQSFRKSMPLWIKEKLFQKNTLIKELQLIDENFSENKLLFSEHHLSHAASAFYPSPFNEAIILTLDGVGEWATTTISKGKDSSIEILEEVNYPHSIGLLYSAFTYFLGFKVNSGEYKVMGLAPYGEPKYVNIILDNLIDLKDDGSFKLNQKYFSYSTHLVMINSKFENLFGQKSRKEDDEEVTQFHMDVAASIQKVTEEIVLKIIKYISKKYNSKNLCLAGGVALNCVVNSKIAKTDLFENIWVQPAAGDAGGSLGAALLTYYKKFKGDRHTENNCREFQPLLGPSFSDEDIENDLIRLGASYEQKNGNDLHGYAAKLLSEGKIIGWFQGKMEFGPRALGARSILADPRRINMQKDLNFKIKFREGFRPFAPAILDYEYENWFDKRVKNSYMLFVSDIDPSKRREISVDQHNVRGFEQLQVNRSLVPAVTHVDYSARVQSVSKELNEPFFKLLENFNEITKCPILVNTSFNVRGEPIICTPEDAYKCFMKTQLDYLVIGSFVLDKKNQLNF